MSTAFGKSTGRPFRLQSLNDRDCKISTKASGPDPKQESNDLTREILHELSQPLTAICSYGAAAMNSLDDQAAPSGDLERLRTSLQQIINASSLAAGIISRFRDAKQGCKFQTRSKEIHGIVQDAIEMLAFPIQEKGIRIRCDAISTRVEVDAVQIQEVLINLIRNSIEAVSKDTGRIEITVAERPGYVKVSVADNGPGIESSAHGDLFQPITSRKQNGMGIGLAVSKSIVQSHGGEIWCSSNKPNGAMFHFTLPIRASASNI